MDLCQSDCLQQSIINMSVRSQRIVQEDENGSKGKSIQDLREQFFKTVRACTDEQALEVIDRQDTSVLQAIQECQAAGTKMEKLTGAIIQYRSNQRQQALARSSLIMKVDQELRKEGTLKLQKLLPTQLILVLASIGLISGMSAQQIQGFVFITISTAANVTICSILFLYLYQIKKKISQYESIGTQGKLDGFNFGSFLKNSKESLRITIPKLNGSSLSLLHQLSILDSQITKMSSIIPVSKQRLVKLRENLQSQLNYEQKMVNSSLLKFQRQLFWFQIFNFVYLSIGSFQCSFEFLIQKLGIAIKQNDSNKQLGTLAIILIGVVGFALLFLFLANIVQIRYILKDIVGLLERQLKVQISEDIGNKAAQKKAIVQQISMHDTILKQQRYCITQSCLKYVFFTFPSKINAEKEKKQGCCNCLKQWLYWMVCCFICNRYKEYLLNKVLQYQANVVTVPLNYINQDSTAIMIARTGQLDEQQKPCNRACLRHCT